MLKITIKLSKFVKYAFDLKNSKICINMKYTFLYLGSFCLKTNLYHTLNIL